MTLSFERFAARVRVGRKFFPDKHFPSLGFSVIEVWADGLQADILKSVIGNTQSLGMQVCKPLGFKIKTDDGYFRRVPTSNLSETAQ